MFHNVLFLQSDIVVGILNAFAKYLMPFPVRKVARIRCFYYIKLKTVKFLPPAEF